MDAVRQVRSFNRRVTQRIGALQDEYLARRRSLGASRVLWEVDATGTDVRSLRARLGVDSGDLSRLLRALEAEGLVQVLPSPTDQRVRVVRLTRSGAAERTELDRLSDELAWSLLEPLDGRQRSRLLEAMATVERLLAAGAVRFGVEDPTGADARACFRAYFAELDARFDNGFDPGHSLPFGAADFLPPAGLFVLARLDGEPVACGAVKFYETEPAYLKRMWVAPAARGLGLGRRLLGELERQAGEQGATATRLETNRNLPEALELYRTAGYVEVAPFNDEPYAHHWFQKELRRD